MLVFIAARSPALDAGLFQRRNGDVHAVDCQILELQASR
jgi:hypothetical protein